VVVRPLHPRAAASLPAHPSRFADPRGRRVVLVAVESTDERALIGASYTALLPGDEKRAIHVVTDARTATSVGLGWMTHGPAWLPLDIVDLAGGVARTIAGAAQRTLVTGADEVLVVVAAGPCRVPAGACAATGQPAPSGARSNRWRARRLCCCQCPPTAPAEAATLRNR
jgi:hypothetical protein